VTYAVNDTDIATVEGNRLRVLKVAPFMVTAKQAGDSTWLPAQLPALVNPLPRPQKIAFTLKGTRTEGQTFSLLVTVNSDLVPIVTSSDPRVVRVEGLNAIAVAPGKAVLTATQPGDLNHAAAKPVKKTVTVK